MTKEQFIKKSKSARIKWLAKNGFSSEEEFLASLTLVKTKSESLDLMIAFDTTGSMSSYITNVKKHIINVVKENFAINPDLRIGVVAFGDYCDMESSTSFGKAYQYLPLSNVEQDIVAFIESAKNTGGGDGDEFYELVIKKITEETNWNEDSNKVVLFIADADPHKVGYSYKDIVKKAQIDWRVEAKKAANKGIKFNTLSIHGENYPWYKKLASLTNGTYLPFKSSDKTSELINATVLAESGAKTRGLFDLKMKSEKDIEMKSVYTSYSLKLK